MYCSTRVQFPKLFIFIIKKISEMAHTRMTRSEYNVSHRSRFLFLQLGIREICISFVELLNLFNEPVTIFFTINWLLRYAHQVKKCSIYPFLDFLCIVVHQLLNTYCELFFNYRFDISFSLFFFLSTKTAPKEILKCINNQRKRTTNKFVSDVIFF